jgi:hypothetical protein
MSKRVRKNPFEGKEDRLRALADRAVAAWGVFGRSVWPLVVINHAGEYEQVASCVLVRIGPLRFVWTAAHVLDWATKSTLSIITGVGLIALSGARFRTPLPPSRNREDDRRDVGFFLLDNGDDIESAECVFLTPDDLDFAERPVYDPERSHYLALGFPMSKTYIIPAEGIMRTKHLSLILMPAPADAYARLGRAPDTHLLLRYRPKRAYTIRGKLTPPNVKGMSGGGIWRFDSSRDLTVSTGKLVAIFTDWSRLSGIWVGYRVSLAGRAIVDLFPELDKYLPQWPRLPAEVRGARVEILRAALCRDIKGPPQQPEYECIQRITSIQARSFPVSPPITLVAGWRFEQGDKYPDAFYAQMVDELGKTVADLAELEIKLQVENDGARGVLVHRFQNIVFARSGLYRVEIVIDGQVHRTLPFNVELARPSL